MMQAESGILDQVRRRGILHFWKRERLYVFNSSMFSIGQTVDVYSLFGDKKKCNFVIHEVHADEVRKDGYLVSYNLPEAVRRNDFLIAAVP